MTDAGRDILPNSLLGNCPDKPNPKGLQVGTRSTPSPNTHLKGKVPILFRELVNFAIHLVLLCLQVLALLQSFMESHGEAAREGSSEIRMCSPWSGTRN